MGIFVREHKRAILTGTGAIAAAVIILLVLRGRGMSGGYQASDYPEEITIDVYDELADTEGVQTGWFAKAVHDRFNMNLNIIAPDQNDATSMLDSMVASGNMTDLVITNAQESALFTLTDRNLLCDMTPYMEDKEILTRYGTAVAAINSNLDGIYAFPSDISTGASTQPSETIAPAYCPYIRWDLYHRAGYPDVDSLDELLTVMIRLQDIARKEYPDRTIYAMSFSADEEGDILQAAAQIAAVYGYESQGVVLTTDNGRTIENILDSNSAYMKALYFLYKAHRRDLIDPESTMQTRADVLSKMEAGEVLFTFDTDLVRQMNTRSRMEGDMGFMPLMIEDTRLLSHGCSATGSDAAVIAVGARAKDPERMADFIDWLYSDEGVMMQQAGTAQAPGPEGLTWQMDNGEPELTSYGRAVLDNASTIAVPDAWGGGNFAEGTSGLQFPAVNLGEQTTGGVPYSYRGWKSTNTQAKTALEQDWEDFYGTDSLMEYLTRNDMLEIEQGGYAAMPREGTEVVVIREGCRGEILEDSWNMVFAGNDAAYAELQAQMRSVCASLNYYQLLRIDTSSARIISAWKRNETLGSAD